MAGLSLELEDGFVYYCKRCHSLMIIQDELLVSEEWDGSYCGKCHSTDIGICHIDEWLEEEERMRKKREASEWNR